MVRRTRKEVETDNDVHALLMHGKNLYQSHLSRKGRMVSLTIADYLRAIVHDMDPEAIAAMRVASRMHQLEPGEYEAFMNKMRKQ